jgi:hypothetical protein
MYATLKKTQTILFTRLFEKARTYANSKTHTQRVGEDMGHGNIRAVQLEHLLFSMTVMSPPLSHQGILPMDRFLPLRRRHGQWFMLGSTGTMCGVIRTTPWRPQPHYSLPKS